MRGADGRGQCGGAASSPLAPRRLSSRLDKLAALLLVAAAASCSSTRWPSGRKYELAETPELIARRGRISLLAADDALQLAWIGARVPPGTARIESAEFVVYEDANGDGEPQADERLLARESRERAEKVMYHDLRAPALPGLQARLTLRIGDAPVRFDFRFKKD